LPCDYNSEKRQISVETEFSCDPRLATAALLQSFVHDLLFQNGLVDKVYWDATCWDVSPGDFLDHESLTYAHALATWSRSGNADSLPVELGSAKASLKYLNKTSDSFFQQSLVENDNLEIDTLIDLAANGKESTRIVAVIEELRLLSDNHDQWLRSKAVQAVTFMGQLDDYVADNAAKMLSSSTNYVTYSGLLALSRLDNVSEDVLKLADRGFERALHTCNYQFIEMFAATYKKWLGDPTDHVNKLWDQSSPEYLQMATEAITAVTEAAKQA